MSRSYAFAPRTMQAPAAAYYLGISESKLKKLPIRRRISDGNRLYDIRDLDTWADNLPFDGEDQYQDLDHNTADLAFGIAAE